MDGQYDSLSEILWQFPLFHPLKWVFRLNHFDSIDLITFWTYLTYVRDSSGYVGVKYLLQHFIFKKLSEFKKKLILKQKWHYHSLIITDNPIQSLIVISLINTLETWGCWRHCFWWKPNFQSTQSSSARSNAKQLLLVWSRHS